MIANTIHSIFKMLKNPADFFYYFVYVAAQFKAINGLFIRITFIMQECNNRKCPFIFAAVSPFDIPTYKDNNKS